MFHGDDTTGAPAAETQQQSNYQWKSSPPTLCRFKENCKHLKAALHDAATGRSGGGDARELNVCRFYHPDDHYRCDHYKRRSAAATTRCKFESRCRHVQELLRTMAPPSSHQDDDDEIFHVIGCRFLHYKSDVYYAASRAPPPFRRPPVSPPHSE